ncbi:MAG: penicillin-binding protein 2 [Acidobacteriota bacterium]
MRGHLEYAEKVRTRRRTLVVMLFFSVTFLAYFFSLWFYQVLHGDDFRVQAANNTLRTLEVPATRGDILDRNGHVLVGNRLSFDVLLNRTCPADPDPLIEFLSETLSLDPATIRERLTVPGQMPQGERVIAEDVSMAQAVAIESRRLEWPELAIAVRSRRFYPEGSLAAHVLGYVGEISGAEIRSGRFQDDLRAGDIIGKTGIERFFEGDLQGHKGYKHVLVNSRGRVVDELGVDRVPRRGRDISLTLDLDLQEALRESLRGRVGAGIFLDPRSGEILAMSSSPAFEPNLFARRFPPDEWKALISDPLKPLQNRSTLSHYSPGSTFKLVVAAAALEEKVITPSTTIFCPGYADLYGHRFRCHKREGHGAMDLKEAIVHSCNVYFYNLGKLLGIERIAAYARRLGLGTRTGIDLVSEDEGLIPTPRWKRETRGQPWYPGETISVSIGQGPLSVTPLQMASVAAALAHGGRPVRPHLLRETARKDPGQAVAAARTGFSAATLRTLRSAMIEVVRRGTGTGVQLPGIQVAAKTGTAQFSSRSAGMDADHLPYAIRDHAWLIGYAPAETPRIAFAVFVEHGGHGGTAAAPVVRRVLARFFGLDKRDPAKQGAMVARGPGGPPRRSSVAAP